MVTQIELFRTPETTDLTLPVATIDSLLDTTDKEGTFYLHTGQDAGFIATLAPRHLHLLLDRQDRRRSPYIQVSSTGQYVSVFGELSTKIVQQQLQDPDILLSGLVSRAIASFQSTDISVVKISGQVGSYMRDTLVDDGSHPSNILSTLMGARIAELGFTKVKHVTGDSLKHWMDKDDGVPDDEITFVRVQK